MKTPRFDYPLSLRGTPKHYHWGRSRRDSIICRLYPELEGERPLAEYWLGAHPSGPSSVRGTSAGGSESGREPLLTELLGIHAGEILGPKLERRFGAALPFLFKILSIAEPLSIQAHPDAAFAAELHRRDPLNYPDAAHKPEVSLALSKTQVLCGLRGTTEDMISLLKLSPPEVIREVKALKGALAEAAASQAHRDALERLIARFPEDDVGILCARELELVELEPGDAIFFPPGVLHAHLTGELIECMASSDNVIRAGLTPKFRDVDALVRLLKNQPADGIRPVIIRAGEPGLGALPVEEFTLQILTRADLPRPGQGLALLFSIDGRAQLAIGNGAVPIVPGDAVLIPHACRYTALTVASGRIVRLTVPER